MKRKKRHYKKIFTVRRDFSHILCLIMLIVLFIIIAILFLNSYKYLESIISFLISGIFLSFLFNNKIVLEQYYIRVFFGVFFIKIKYQKIKKVYKCENNYCSLASSTYRVGIKTSKYKSSLFDTFISPMDRDNFIEKVRDNIL